MHLFEPLLAMLEMLEELLARKLPLKLDCEDETSSLVPSKQK